MNHYRFPILFLILAIASGFADSRIEMSCEHSYISEMQEIIIYYTLSNKTSEPIEVITCLPNAGVTIRGGSWMFSLQSTWYAKNSGPETIPLRERLLPVTIPPHQKITFTQRFSSFGNIPQIDEKTYVSCQYKVMERDAERYKVWGGELITQSKYVPFYRSK